MAIQAQLLSDNLGFSMGGTQDWMDNACGVNNFFFNQNLQLQQQQQKQQQQQQLQALQQRNQNLFLENRVLLQKTDENHHQPMFFPQGFASEIEKQRQEIDRFISLQNERLRLALQEQRKQQILSILRQCESKAQILLNQKDQEIAKAVNKTMELEDFLRRIEIENQTWQRAAKENEAMVISLNNTIGQVRENSCFSTNGGEDAESCCEGEKTGEHREKTGQNDEERERERKMICKSCNSRNSCCIFLPCRHLCTCKTCEAFLDSCPVCEMVKKATIEVLL